MPENLPDNPLRYMRRDRKVIQWSGDLTSFHTQAETVLQWLGPDGEWRDVPTVEEKTDDEQT